MADDRARSTISIDPQVDARARQMMAMEKRDFSNFCEVALVAYMDGRPDPSQTAEVMAAVEQVGPERALEALRAEARRKRRRVAV